jgi:hypothetical protein
VPGDGRVGRRFRSRDSNSLGAILEDALADDAARERVVAEAREHVLQFDWAMVARETRRLYGDLIPLVTTR